MSVIWEGQPGPLKTDNGKFTYENGAAFAFQGVSWSGFELGRGMLDGLNKEYPPHVDLDSGLVRDYRVVATRIKLLGFNTIRLPFSFSVCCTL